jgi:precorrin-6B methylase 2
MLLARAASDKTECTHQRSTVPAAVFIATPQDVVDAMLTLANVRREDVLYDLGCGDGRVVITAAKRYGCRAVGVDIDPLRVTDARANVRRSGVDRLVGIEQRDMFELNLDPATVVTLYLSPSHNARLLPQLAKLKPGSRVVSHQFGIPRIKPNRVVEMTSKVDGKTHTIYLWVAPMSSASRP